LTQTKRTRRKDARPSDIIDAAVAEFAEKGYSGTSIGSIAARAQIARSTVYLYFDDKEALIQEAFRVRIGAVVADVRTATELPDLPFPDLLREMLIQVYARLVDGDTIVLLRVLIAEGHHFPQLVRFYHETILSAAKLVITRLIARGIARGEVRADAAELDPKLVMAPVIMAAIWRLTFEDIEALDMPRFVDGHLSLLTDGLLVR